MSFTSLLESAAHQSLHESLPNKTLNCSALFHPRPLRARGLGPSVLLNTIAATVGSTAKVDVLCLILGIKIQYFSCTDSNVLIIDNVSKNSHLIFNFHI